MKTTTLKCDICGAEADYHSRAGEDWFSKFRFEALSDRYQGKHSFAAWSGDVCEGCRIKRIEAPVRAILDGLLERDK